MVFFLKRHGSQFGSIWQNWKFEDEFVKGYKVWGPVLNFSQTLISLSLPLLIGKKNVVELSEWVIKRGKDERIDEFCINIANKKRETNRKHKSDFYAQRIHQMLQLAIFFSWISWNPHVVSPLQPLKHNDQAGDFQAMKLNIISKKFLILWIRPETWTYVSKVSQER